MIVYSYQDNIGFRPPKSVVNRRPADGPTEAACRRRRRSTSLRSSSNTTSTNSTSTNPVRFCAERSFCTVAPTRNCASTPSSCRYGGNRRCPGRTRRPDASYRPTRPTSTSSGSCLEGQKATEEGKPAIEMARVRRSSDAENIASRSSILCQRIFREFVVDFSLSVLSDTSIWHKMLADIIAN